MSDDFQGITDTDIYLFNEGTHARLYDKLGAHPCKRDGRHGVHFAVWAPNAAEVSLVADVNHWEHGKTPLEPVESSGIWAAFVPDADIGCRYKYHIRSREADYHVDKADPFAFQAEVPPATGSIVADPRHEWSDRAWMRERKDRQSLASPISIYEVHLGSWRRNTIEGFRSLTYRELATELVDYVSGMGFTHVELMPVTEHPFYGSWGYQVTGYFAPTSRYGSPEDFMFLVDRLHQHGIGVILDWVPAHFPADEHGLGYFDGTHLFEHADRRQGYHPDWNSLIYNYGRNEVRAFLLSSAMFWLDRYHIDGLRVDGVASMLYLDYSRKEGEWIPNRYGGRENLEAISLLRQVNETVYAEYPDVQTIAEESTAWPGVSRPVYVGGLGFGFKWDMGWMHDTLSYFAHEPVHRKYHQNELTFRAIYAFHENFVLSLSHDEVVHGKGSLLGRMPGDDWQKRANLRLLFSYMYALPGKKLMFMGLELGQPSEWNHDDSLPWHLLDVPEHAGIATLVRELNRLYRERGELYALDASGAGFEWVDTNDNENSVLTFLRRAEPGGKPLVCVLNMTPVVRENYRIGVDLEGTWTELLNSDAARFGGSGVGNPHAVEAAPLPWHGRPLSINLTLPPLAALWMIPA